MRKLVAASIITVITILFQLACIALAHAAQPLPLSYSAQWSRTPVTRGAPDGVGCIRHVATATAAQMFHNSGARVVWSLPLQVIISNTSSSAVKVCASQDPTPIITGAGNFSAATNGTYAAGRGMCTPMIPSLSVYFFGVALNSFGLTSGTERVGMRRGECTSGNQPCDLNADCNAGTCSLTSRPRGTYLFLINEAGSGSGYVDVCEIE
ncbi:hypothetical protein [Bacteriophage sp.]|nr:hypothetical protein [Bacteriophage sp.]UOF80129.1 hypothetical protein [Bacteriophage sp.]